MSISSNYPKWIWMFFFLIFHGIISAEEQNSILTNHIIIAVDQALPAAYRTVLSNNQGVTSAINESLTVNGVYLIKNGDYLSLVNFLADRGEKSLENFALVPLDMKGKPMCWVKSEGSLLQFLRMGEWGKIMYRESLAERESLLSAAKHAALMATMDGGKANKTFIVMITDDHYNGMDNVNHDLDNFVNSSAIPYREKQKIKHDYLNLCQKINSNFSFNFIKESYICGSYRAMLFEVSPTYSASLPVLLRYPSTYNLHRVKGGYKVGFVFDERNAKYVLDSLSLTICDQTFTYNSSNDKHVDLYIPSSSIESDSISVEVKGWFTQRDGIYNGYQYSPFDKTQDSKAIDLSLRENIALPKDATVFSVPLSDTFWIWYKDDAIKAAFIWEVVIVSMLLIVISLIVRSAVGLYIKVAQQYEPEDKIIKIKKIN